VAVLRSVVGTLSDRVFWPALLARGVEWTASWSGAESGVSPRPWLSSGSDFTQGWSRVSGIDFLRDARFRCGLWGSESGIRRLVGCLGDVFWSGCDVVLAGQAAEDGFAAEPVVCEGRVWALIWCAVRDLNPEPAE
jgi:hypothetical protein